MNVLLSIKPCYAEAILSEVKKYEFRRVAFRRKDIHKVYLYANSDIRKIVGSFEIDNILEGTPKEIWEKCHLYGGISKKEFFNYFKGAKKAFAIKIKNVHRFEKAIDPRVIIENFTCLRSFRYLTYDIEEWIK